MCCYYQLGLGVTKELALQLLQLPHLEYSTLTTWCINLQNLLTQNSDSSPKSEPTKSSPKLEEPPTRINQPTMSSPYQWITGSQRRTPLPALHTAHPSPISTSGLFQPSSLTTENLQSISVDHPIKPTPKETSVIPPSLPLPTSSYARASSKERRALVAAYLQQNPEPHDPQNDDKDDMPEIKAGLPRNFSRKEEDANLWLLTMKVYFAMNPSLYKEKEKNKILAFLNKMDTGRGKSFAEGWLMKCADPNIHDEDWNFEKIKADFKEKFIPTNWATKAQHAFTHMAMEEEPFKGDFHKFCWTDYIE